jgi:ribosomal protein L25 (general stress protein Ctc)
MKEYKYSILGNVTGQIVDTQRLHKDIEESLALSTAKFRGVVRKNDDLYVLFNKNIETSEKTTLDTLVQDHSDDPVPAKTRHIPFYPNPKQVSDSYYTTTGCFLFPGKDLFTTISEINILSMMSPGATSYDVQIVNRETNKIIAEQNFTNTTIQTNTFSTVHTGNISTTPTGIEVLTKLNQQGNAANKLVHIDQVIFWLD